MLKSTTLLVKGAELVVECSRLRAGANVIVLCDKDRWIEGEAVAGVCQARGAHPMILDVTTEVMWYYNNLKRPIPKPHLLGAMMGADFCFAVADGEYCHGVGHTDSQHDAQRNGMRYVIVEEYMSEWKTTRQDIDAFVARTHRLTEMVSQCSEVVVTTAKGTNMVFPRKTGADGLSFIPIGGEMSCVSPNYGESAMVPQEWAAHGHAVIDGILVGLGEMGDDPVIWEVEDGRIAEVKGGTNAQRFRQFLADSGENAGAIAECGICTSHVEKRAYEYAGRPPHWSVGGWGTVHIGIGHNTTIGGEITSPIHVDCQMYDTTVAIDGVKVMDSGKYLW